MSPEPPGHEPTPEEEQRLKRLLGEEDADELGQRAESLLSEHETTSQERAAELEKIDAEFESRMKEADAKIQAQRIKREAVAEKVQKSSMESQDAGQGLAKGLSIAYGMLGLPVFGAGVGWLADKSLGTANWTGIGALIGAVLGMAYAVLLQSKMS